MDTNSGKLLAKEEVFQIVGSAIEVLNALGHGILEKPYENALAVEFGLRKIPFQQQAVFDVLYKRHKVGLFIPDLTAFDTVVVDTKVIDRITDHERGLMLNYCGSRNCELELSLILSTPNWSGSELSYKKFVFICVHSWLEIERRARHSRG
jgi:GxxExxY protein